MSIVESEIPFEDFGGNGPRIHFAHANGFPPKTYKQLIADLTQNHHVVAMNARPLWPNSDYHKFASWETAADDLIRFLDNQGFKNIIGMGHSFGAICTLIAAQKRPDLFSKLVLIEPVVLPIWYYRFTALMPQFLVKQINPIVKKTLVRKELWPDKETAFKHFRRSRLFAQVSDACLWDYVNSVLEEKDGGVALSYTKEWEATIFLTVINPWKALKNIQHPTLIIRGETSDTIFPKVWKQLKTSTTNAKLTEMADCGHLVPIEKPTELATHIHKFLNSDR